MKILFLTNNPLVSDSLYDWLVARGENVCYGNEPIDAEFIRQNHIDFIVSYNYQFIITRDTLEVLPHRVINLHISLLPYNRGASPNIWSFIDGTPGGVTIHEVDKGLDTGDILLQQSIVFDPNAETLRSSYDKLHQMIQGLFRENWDSLKSLKITPKKQPLYPLMRGGYARKMKDMNFFMHILNYDDKITVFLEKLSHLNPSD